MDIAAKPLNPPSPRNALDHVEVGGGATHDTNKNLCYLCLFYDVTCESMCKVRAM